MLAVNHMVLILFFFQAEFLKENQRCLDLWRKLKVIRSRFGLG